MVAIKFRMDGGIAGEVNRTHPASIEAVVQDSTNPVLGYGYGCVLNAAGTGIRQMASGDTAVANIWGIVVRPYPQQQYTDTVGWGNAAFGNVTPPGGGNVVDVITAGYVIVPAFGSPQKGAPAYIRIATPGTGKVVGDFESAADGSNTAAVLNNVVFNSGLNANGTAEVIIGLR